MELLHYRDIIKLSEKEKHKYAEMVLDHKYSNFLQILYAKYALFPDHWGKLDKIRLGDIKTLKRFIPPKK